jgi:hypothetical protein
MPAEYRESNIAADSFGGEHARIITDFSYSVDCAVVKVRAVGDRAAAPAR